jgi:hypothetical protein
LKAVALLRPLKATDLGRMELAAEAELLLAKAPLFPFLTEVRRELLVWLHPASIRPLG